MQLFEGRPETTEGRLAREVRTYDFLDSLGIHYMRTDHEATTTMEACNAVDGVLELMSPERSAVMIERMGSAGYYAMTIIRTVVLVITAVAFGRVAYKNLKDKQ